MNDDDAERLGIIDVAELPLLAVIDDAAVVVAVGIDAAQHFHQGRLAGAVLADQGMDLALPDGEIDAVQRLHAGEGFADTAHLEQCGHSDTLGQERRRWPQTSRTKMPRALCPATSGTARLS